MDRYLHDPDPMGSPPACNTSIPTSARSDAWDPESIRHIEQKSETSSNSEKSSGSRNMNRGNQRGGRGESRGGRGGNRTYSGSSGSSNGQYNPNRPTLKAASGPQSSQAPHTRMAVPEQPPGRVETPLTSVKQLSSFNLNGHSINETYIARTSATSTPSPAKPPVTSPPRQVTRASPQHGGNRPRYNSADHRNSQRPILRGGAQHWAHYQEAKFRLSGIPKNYWTKDVYNAMSSFGTVFRIDMVTGTRDNAAYVVFR
jgi:RNA-dependent RNA polymerase